MPQCNSAGRRRAMMIGSRMPASFRIGFLLYEGLTQLDLTGPAQVLSRMPGAVPVFVGKSMAPVMSDCGLALMPTCRLAESSNFDMICVPGGYGVVEAMADAEILTWLRQQAVSARLVSSVCNGSLLLAAAGLLRGRRAGCHWAWGHALPWFGAIHEPKRVVVDGPFMTAGGVTAGIDFAFQAIDALAGRDVAETVQLALEYDPAPLAGGTPATARPEILSALQPVLTARMADSLGRIRQIAGA